MMMRNVRVKKEQSRESNALPVVGHRTPIIRNYREPEPPFWSMYLDVMCSTMSKKCSITALPFLHNALKTGERLFARPCRLRHLRF